MLIGNRTFNKEKKVYIMGILNVTEDSFSDGGKYLSPEMAVRHAEEMIRDGVDVIDIGAESTRPGYQEISVEEEIGRLVPVIRKLRENFDVPVSVDSYKAEVMDAALGEGADLANDIWGFRYEELHPDKRTGGLSMAEVVAKYHKPVVLMHNDLLERDAGLRTEAQYRLSGISPEGEKKLVVRIKEGFARSIAIAEAAGVPKDQILLDPGVGFAKTQDENMECLARLSELIFPGCEMLLGASRKSVIGNALQVPPEEREEGTMVTSMLAADAGYLFVRVHDVKKNRRTLDFLRFIREKNAGKPVK